MLLRQLSIAPGFHEIGDLVADSAGMDAEMAMPGERRQQRRRQCADARLQRRSALDETGELGRDGQINGVGFACGHFQ